MTFQVHAIDGGLAVSGELDMSGATEFWELASSALDPSREVVLDLGYL